MTLKNERGPDKGEPLFIPIMEKGELIYDFPELEDICGGRLKTRSKDFI